MPRLFLGNIPHTVNEDDISEWMHSHGFTVESVDIITDRVTGNRRGFCFATLAEHMELDAAVAALNGRFMAGRPITVSRAVPLYVNGSNRRRPA
jgi:cold-inducible RNA-binding protein